MVLQKHAQSARSDQRYGLAIEEIKLKRAISKIDELLNGTGPNVNHQLLKSQLLIYKRQLAVIQDLRNQQAEAQFHEKPARKIGI